MAARPEATKIQFLLLRSTCSGVSGLGGDVYAPSSLLSAEVEEELYVCLLGPGWNVEGGSSRKNFCKIVLQ